MLNEITSLYFKCKEVKEASGSIMKKNILAKYKEDNLFKEILKFMYDPLKKSGISKAKCDKINEIFESTKAMPIAHMSMYNVLDILENCNTGNNDTLTLLASFLKGLSDAYDLEYCANTDTVQFVEVLFDELKNFYFEVISQSYKMGASAKSINAAFGENLIFEFDIMKGTDMSKDASGKLMKAGSTYIVTEKLDGIRRVLIKKNGVVKMYSRSGHEDKDCLDIIEEAYKFCPDNTMIEGELTATGIFNNVLELRQKTMSIANSSGKKTGLLFQIFDMVPLNEFEGVAKTTAWNRKLKIADYFNDLYDRGNAYHHLNVPYHDVDRSFKDTIWIRGVPILGVANNYDKAMQLYREIVTRDHSSIMKAGAHDKEYYHTFVIHGGEGVMLLESNSVYQKKRSKDLLKIKHLEEYTLKIVDMSEGKGRLAGTLGQLHLEYKGNIVKCGSGLTDAQRDKLWRHKDKYINLFAEIESFGQSKDASGKESLNCPIFKRLKGAE